MRILILGGDGYLGWPTAMDLALKNHDVYVVDNYLRRKIAKDTNSDPLFFTPKLPEKVKRFKSLTDIKVKFKEIIIIVDLLCHLISYSFIISYPVRFPCILCF